MRQKFRGDRTNTKIRRAVHQSKLRHNLVRDAAGFNTFFGKQNSRNAVQRFRQKGSILLHREHAEQFDDTHRKSFLVKAFCCRKHLRRFFAIGNQSKLRRLGGKPVTDRKTGSAFGIKRDKRCSIIGAHTAARITQNADTRSCKSACESRFKFLKAVRCVNFHAGDFRQERTIENALVRFAVAGDKTGTIKCKHHMQLLQSHIMN